MKNQILDIRHKDSISDFSARNEEILWEGNAALSQYSISRSNKKWYETEAREFFIIILTMSLSFIYGFLFSNVIYIPINLFFFVGLILYLLSYFLRQQGSNPAEYVVTNRQILFKSISNNKIEIFDIPFSQIKNCLIIKDEGSRNGAIILAVKNPMAIPFDTYTIAGNGQIEKRHQPSLENLREVDEVAKLIREGIKNAKA